MSGDRFRQIRVGPHRVAIVGLDEIFEMLKSSPLSPDEKKRELLRQVKKKNYIPEGAEKIFEEALWNEFQRFLGEDVEYDYGGNLVIQILGTSCAKCDTLEHEVKSALAELEIDAIVEHISDPVEISRFGPLITPALVINGRIYSQGKVLPRKKIIEIIRLAIEQNK